MDGLRWLLLLFGLVVVIGVYFYSRKDRENTKETPLSPDLDESQPDMERRAPSFGNEPAEPAESDDESPQPDQRIITLRIVAGDSGAFSGENLILSLRGIGMRHGKFGIFHQYDGTDESKIVFSAASLVEPGSFDLENIREQQIPGISLFMVLPSVIDAVVTGGRIIGLAKPQFEAKRVDVGRGGVVRDPRVRAGTVGKVCLAGLELGLRMRGVSGSVLAGPKGNREVFVLFEK